MNLLNTIRLAVIAILLTTSVNAQQATVSNVLNLRALKSRGTVVENDKLVGYFLFYFKEKKDKKTSDYEIELYDNNYNLVKSFTLTRPKNSVLMQTVYNGDVFLCFFYDYKVGLEFVTYSRDGEELGSDEVSKSGLSNLKFQMEAQTRFYPLGKTGFSRTAGNKIISYDNDMNETWVYESKLSTKKENKTIALTSITDDFIVATIYKKKSLMTKKMDLEFILLDAKTGELITELEMGNSEIGKESVLNSYYDESQDKIVITGEYFAPGDDILKDKSVGFFAKEYSKDGSLLIAMQYAWKDEIKKFTDEQLDEEDKKEASKNFSLYFHDAIRAKNGHLFLIAEQFKKQISGGAVAGKIIAGALGGSSNAAGIEVRVGNMVVIELDEEYNLIDYKIVKKKKSSVLLQEGMGFYGTSFLGYYVKSMGGFDYSFSSRDSDNDEFTIVYTDGNRKESKEDKNTDKADKMLGLIQINAGVCETSRVPLNTDAKTWWIQEAKTGHVSITEYYKKEKKLEMRLEQLSY